VQEIRGFNSMILTTRAAELMPEECESVDDALAKVLGGLAAWAEEVGSFSVPEVCNPSLPSEDLARNWSAYDFAVFKNKVRAAAADAATAIGSDDEQKTIDLWNGANLFDGFFPTKKYDLDRAKSVASRFSNGTSRVDSLGRVGTVGVVTKPTRGFFGES
jgi:hypothetical protein